MVIVQANKADIVQQCDIEHGYKRLDAQDRKSRYDVSVVEQERQSSNVY